MIPLEILATLVLDISVSLYYINYIYWADKYGAWLYSKGLTTRCKSSINYDTSRRNYREMILEDFFTAVTTFMAPSWYMATKIAPVYETIDFSFKPFETWLSLVALYVFFDTWYFFTHRLVHEIPAVYTTIHKRHHDTLPVDTYVVGRAEILENLILTTPGVMIWAFVYLNFAPAPNVWAIFIPVVSLTSDFVLVHVGYYDTIYMYALNPFSLVVQYSLFSSGNVTRHELHHNLFTKNYSPMFPWFDRIFGTIAEATPNYWGITVADEREKQNNHPNTPCGAKP
eukprot:Phypoly_transcript_14194.p1 GENE.Phypoly_transcript_14194~~Phypoly_transcript_14194.p1  ORF type:complete len:284 (+),score=27.49 Phypoly_transcript_14194:69-920(+)